MGDPTSNLFNMGCGQPEQHGLSLGHLLYEGHGDLDGTLLVQRHELQPPVGWLLHPGSIPPNPVLWLFQWVWHGGHLGLALLVVVGLVEGAELVLGLAPLAVAECCWSPSFFDIVASGHVGWLVAMGVL